MELKGLPTKLNEITLEKWIGWESTYGRYMKRDAPKKMTHDEQLLFNSDFYTKHYAWYSDSDYEEIKATLATDPDFYIEVMKVSAESLILLFGEMKFIDNVDLVNAVFEFNGNAWQIKPPVEVIDSAKLTVAEFEISQDVALIMSDLQDGKDEALIELCSMYLHEILPPDVKVVHSDFRLLPLGIALCVKKYVQDTINLYKSLTYDRESAST